LFFLCGFVPVQARDYLAIVNKKGPGVFDELQELMPFAYAALVALPARDYHNMIDDISVVNEEPGEASFSALTRTVSCDPNKQEYNNLRRAYQMNGVTRAATRNYEENMGRTPGSQKKAHFDIQKQQDEEVAALTTHLRQVAQNGIEGFMEIYVMGEPGVKRGQKGGV
jgi:hypothetical protein